MPALFALGQHPALVTADEKLQQLAVEPPRVEVPAGAVAAAVIHSDRDIVHKWSRRE